MTSARFLALWLMLLLAGCTTCDRKEIEGVDCVMCEKVLTVGGVGVTCDWSKND